jgi:hypothetical protein
MRTLLLAVLVSLSPAFAQNQALADISIRHVTVIDVRNGTEKRDQTVRIRGERIYSITPTQDSDAELPGAVDGNGGFLIPGLWDMHVHIHDTNELTLYVANGVLGVRVMSGDRDSASFRAELKRNTPSPEIYLSSAIVDGDPPVWPGSVVIKNAEDARRTVKEIRASGADFIKVYNRIPRDAYFALADEAKQQQISFAGHTPDNITAQEASDAGQRSIEHLTGIAVACSRNQRELMVDLGRARFFQQHLEIEAEALRNIDQAKCKALFTQFRMKDTWQVPTLTVRRMWGMLGDSQFTSDARLAYINRRSRGGWQQRAQDQQRRWSYTQFLTARGVFSSEKSIVGVMYRAGVPIMAGTDSMNPYCFPGFSLHDELAMMVEASLSPLAALQAATLNPAKFLGRSEELGAVEPGKIASLVLLRSDPLLDIHNTTTIEAVWLHGKYINREQLNKMLDVVKQASK